MGTFIDFSPSSTQSQIKKKATTETNLQSILVQVKSIFEKTTYTSMMVGEEGGGTPGKPPVDKPAPPTMSTQAIGEEGGGTPGKPPVDKPVPPDEVTTMVTGEEGGGTPAKPPVDIVKPVPPVKDTTIAKQRVKEGKNFIKNHIKDITKDAVSSDTEGNGIVHKSIDAKKAFKFFNKMQGDKGIAAPGNNGSDFNVGAIKDRIQVIKTKLENKEILPENKSALKNELGMLKAIKAANKDGDKVVTAEEMNVATKDGRLHFGVPKKVPTEPEPPVLTPRVKEGRNFIKEHLEDIKSDDTISNDITADNKGNTISNKIIDSKNALELFNILQGDKGIEKDGSNGSDFGIASLKKKIQIIKDKLKDLDKLPLRDAGVTQTALENELGMLKEIKSANKDGDKVVTAKEMNAITKDGKLHFQTKTALESDDPVETKPKPPSTIQDFILEILKKLFEGLFGQKPITSSDASPGSSIPPQDMIRYLKSGGNLSDIGHGSGIGLI
jgi:hypothetical protein